MADPPPHQHHHHHQQKFPDRIFFTSPNPSLQPPVLKRRRGRPRKYGSTSFIPSSALSSLTHTTTSTSIPRPNKPFQHKDSSGNALFRKKTKVPFSAGQGFTPHVIMVAAGEDVAMNVLSFVQQCKRSVCILSAFGSVCNASLCPSGMFGANVTYDGRYEIIMLSGSFLYTESGGAITRNGGMNVCLSGTDGRVVGGGIDGSLVAASTVQVIVGSFLMQTDKNVNDSSSKDNVLLSPTSLRSLQESTVGTTLIEGSNDRLGFGGGGNIYMVQSQADSMMPSGLSTDWRGGQVLVHGKSQFIPDNDDEGNCRD